MVRNLKVVHSVLHCPKWPHSTTSMGDWPTWPRS